MACRLVLWREKAAEGTVWGLSVVLILFLAARLLGVLSGAIYLVGHPWQFFNVNQRQFLLPRKLFRANLS